MILTYQTASLQPSAPAVYALGTSTNPYSDLYVGGLGSLVHINSSGITLPDGTVVTSAVSLAPVKVTDNALASPSQAIQVDATTKNITVTLTTALSAKGQFVTVIKIDATGHTVTIAAAGANTINGATSQILYAQYEYIRVYSDGTTWWID